MPWGSDVAVEHRAGELISRELYLEPIQPKEKAQTTNRQYIRKKQQGNAKRFRRKRGKIDTHSAEGEKLLGENSCKPYRNNTVRLETHTSSRDILVWVCSNTNASASPPHSESFPSGAQWGPKVPSKVYITTRPAKQHNTHAHAKAAKALRWKFDHRSNRRRLLRHRRRRHRPRAERTELSTERKLPEKYKQQTSISWSIQVLLVFSLPLKQTDRSHTHIYTRTHTSTEKQTSNVCIAPIFVPFCDKYLILSFLVFSTFFYFLHTTLCLILVLVFSSHTTTKQ